MYVFFELMGGALAVLLVLPVLVALLGTGLLLLIGMRRTKR